MRSCPLTDSVAYHRLRSHSLTPTTCTRPVDVVAWFGAIQAQDLDAAAWALALRSSERTSASEVHAAIAKDLLRIHVVRQTWHLVSSPDVRWMLDLSAPQMRRGLAPSLRRFELDQKTCAKALSAFERELEKGRHVTRRELGVCLSRIGINAKGPRLALLTVLAEVEGTICSGFPCEEEQTYALFAARVPSSRTPPREESIAALTTRYLRSHGPATTRDFIWWSGLTKRDVGVGLSLTMAIREVIEGVEYWSLPNHSAHDSKSVACLLPAYDEYLLGYRDAAAVPRPRAVRGVVPAVAVMDGQVVGTWVHLKDAHSITLTLFAAATSIAREPLLDAVHRYGAFVGDAGIGVVVSGGR